MKAVGEEVPLFRPEGAGQGARNPAWGEGWPSALGLRGAGARDTE